MPSKQFEETEYTTLALPSLLDPLQEEGEHAVLDLGLAIGANVDFFAQFSCKLYVADLFRALESRPRDKTEEEEDEDDEEETLWAPIFEELLPYDEGTRFDLILAWDLLNYLDRSQIEGLSHRLSQFCHSGTTLFALVSTRKEIPGRPRSYHIVGHDKLLYRTANQSVRPCPLYKEPDICRRMAGFRVKSTYILRNGIQEYVFSA